MSWGLCNSTLKHDPKLKQLFQLSWQHGLGQQIPLEFIATHSTQGRLLVGADVAVAVWSMTPGRRWLGWLVGLPGIRQIARWGYTRFADRLFAWNKRAGRW